MDKQLQKKYQMQKSLADGLFQNCLRWIKTFNAERTYRLSLDITVSPQGLTIKQVGRSIPIRVVMEE